MPESISFGTEVDPQEKAIKESLQGFAQPFQQQLQQNMQISAQLKMADFMNRLQQAQQQQQMQRALPGLTKLFGEDASALVNTPANMQGPIVKGLMERQGNQEYAKEVSQFLNDRRQGSMPQGALQQPGNTGMPVDQPTGMTASQPTGMPAKPLIKISPNMTKAQLHDIGHIAIDEARHDENMALKRDNFAHKVSQDKLKNLETTDARYRKEYQAAVKKTRDSTELEAVLLKMQDLVDNGELPDPATYKAVESLSQGVFGFAINPNKIFEGDTEEYRKLSQFLFNDVGDLVRGKVSNLEFQLYGKRIPDLLNTDVGKREILHDMLTTMHYKNQRTKVMQEIEKENHGYLPRNFDDLVDQKMKKIDADYIKEFRKKVKRTEGKTVPGTQSGTFEGQTRTNKRTGEVQTWKGGKWNPM